MPTETTRRWFQFYLPTLFVSVALGIALGWVIGRLGPMELVILATLFGILLWPRGPGPFIFAFGTVPVDDPPPPCDPDSKREPPPTQY